MLSKQGSGTEIICTEQSIPEFPNLLFGTETESGRTFFDATIYLQKQRPEKNIRDFFSQYRKPIESLCESYDIQYDNFCKISKSGHYLIDGNFVYLFIAFVEPNFLGYVFDRIHDLFSNGIAISDTYLLQAAHERLTKEMFNAMSDENESNA